MKLTQTPMDVIEMTDEEETALWHTYPAYRMVCGKRVLHWMHSDGDNEIQLEGESFYRPIIRPRSPNIV